MIMRPFIFVVGALVGLMMGGMFAATVYPWQGLLVVLIGACMSAAVLMVMGD